MYPSSQCCIIKDASFFGRNKPRSISVFIVTPFHFVFFLLHAVTQCMSISTSVVGREQNSFQFSFTSFLTSPKILNSHSFSTNSGTGP